MPIQHVKKTKKRKIRKNTSKKRIFLRKKGGCGCNSNNLPFIKGGHYVNPATFTSETTEGSNFYPLNSYNVTGSEVTDPIDANYNMNTRNLPNFTGGSKKRTKKKTKK